MDEFEVEILSFNTISELPNAWLDADYLGLLSKTDYENPEEIKPAELKEMCMMSLTDFEPADAAQIVLEYLAGAELSHGQIENLAHQLITEKLWEENPRLSLHQIFFNATQLLHDAFNGTFPRTEAVHFQIRITAMNAEDLKIFEENPEAPLLRLIARGMSERSLVNRLFGDQIDGPRFEEARDMIWQLHTKEITHTSVIFDIVSSAYWFDDIKYADTYRATSHADEANDPA
jgi:hypothetical protein